MFVSRASVVGRLDLPLFAGIRIMMMPFRIEAPEKTLPDYLWTWLDAIAALCALSPVRTGTGYLTIDEAIVRTGETHRRPGLHVDGCGAWGAPNPSSPWAAKGMLLASSHPGCRVWLQDFDGEPDEDGGCEHLRDQLVGAGVVMQPGIVWHCDPLAVHEAVPMPNVTARQLVRLSMPSEAPWFEGYTENPLGIRPVGPILPRRPGMDFRPGGS